MTKETENKETPPANNNSEQEKPLTTRDKIFIGGLGALTPIIMNLLVVDLEKLLISLTIISVIAYFIKVVLLFYIGGIVAFLNKDENKPIKLFQLGIYAPAMIIAFMNSNPLNTGTGVQGAPIPLPKVQEEQNVKADDKDERSASIINAGKATGKILGTPASPQLAQKDSSRRDTMSPETFMDIMRTIEVEDSVFLSPMLDKMAATDAAIIDTLMLAVNNRKKTLANVQLKDTALYEFNYPKETTREQFLRGFFGWGSDRLWYVVVGKFEDYESAEMFAKNLTYESNKDELLLVADKAGNTINPQIFKPYGDMVPEYCVVIGTNLNYTDAQALQARIIGKKYKVIQKESVELWKLPY